MQVRRVIQLKDLAIGYFKKDKPWIVCDRINFDALQGEVIALIGHNGIGKSTLLRTIIGVQDSISGQVFVNGLPVSAYKRQEYAKVMAFVSTEPYRIPNAKVYDLVAAGRFPYTNWMGRLTTDDHRLIMESLNAVGLAGLKDRFADEISDGEKQRVNVARALTQDTNIIVLDEPTAFLDIANRYHIMKILRDIGKNQNKTIIYSTHDLNLAMSLADKIWLMSNDGMIEGAPEDLVFNHEFDKLFEAEDIVFDYDKGEFSFLSEKHFPVFVEGDGYAVTWTSRALMRLGFRIANNRETQIRIDISRTGTGFKWRLSYLNNKEYFCNIYDLSLYLKKHFLK